MNGPDECEHVRSRGGVYAALMALACITFLVSLVLAILAVDADGFCGSSCDQANVNLGLALGVLGIAASVVQFIAAAYRRWTVAVCAGTVTSVLVAVVVAAVVF